MLGRRRRRRTNINPSLGQSIVFAGIWWHYTGAMRCLRARTRMSTFGFVRDIPHQNLNMFIFSDHNWPGLTPARRLGDALTLKALKYFYKPKVQRAIFNKWHRYLFLIHLNTYVTGLRPNILILSVRGPHLYARI